jgi:hypothetical protein
MLLTVIAIIPLTKHLEAEFENSALEFPAESVSNLATKYTKYTKLCFQLRRQIHVFQQLGPGFGLIGSPRRGGGAGSRRSRGSGMFRCTWDILGLVQMADPQFSSTDIPCCSPFEIWNALFIEIQPTETFRCILFVPCVDFFHKTGIPGSYWPLDPMRYSSSQELQLGCC